MLQISNITKCFPGSFEPTLKNINLNLNEGDFCIVIGSNGSGKSTLLRSLSGEYAIQHGNITINYQDVTHVDRSHLIATVIQDSTKGLIPDMTLLENMVLSRLRRHSASFRLYKHYQSDIRDQIQSLEIDLEHYLHRPLHNLSGGQRQMVATLMALYSNPHILLLDEHTSALDPHTQAKLMQFTADAIAKSKVTTLMVTHKLDDAIRYGNRLIVIHKGKIILNVANEEKSALTSQCLLSLLDHKEGAQYEY